MGSLKVFGEFGRDGEEIWEWLGSEGGGKTFRIAELIWGEMSIVDRYGSGSIRDAKRNSAICYK